MRNLLRATLMLFVLLILGSANLQAQPLANDWGLGEWTTGWDPLGSMERGIGNAANWVGGGVSNGLSAVTPQNWYESADHKQQRQAQAYKLAQAAKREQARVDKIRFDRTRNSLAAGDRVPRDVLDQAAGNVRGPRALTAGSYQDILDAGAWQQTRDQNQAFNRELFGRDYEKNRPDYPQYWDAGEHGQGAFRSVYSGDNKGDYRFKDPTKDEYYRGPFTSGDFSGQGLNHGQTYTRQQLDKYGTAAETYQQKLQDYSPTGLAPLDFYSSGTPYENHARMNRRMNDDDRIYRNTDNPRTPWPQRVNEHRGGQDPLVVPPAGFFERQQYLQQNLPGMTGAPAVAPQVVAPATQISNEAGPIGGAPTGDQTSGSGSDVFGTGSPF